MSAHSPSGSAPAITVFRGWEDRGKHVWSPYVIKLETRLRLAGVDYDVGVGSAKTGPKGKIPYIEFRPGGNKDGKVTLGDSTLITKTLADWGVVPDLLASLAPEQRAQDLALRALLEEKLYFYHSWERWIGNYYAMRDHVLWSLPYPVKVVVGVLIHRNVAATLHGQGTMRHSPEEIEGFREEIWAAFSDLLRAAKENTDGADAAEPFWVLGSESPSEADCVLFGFIVSVLICTAAPDSQKLVKGFPVLLEYAERIHDRYFPDYEKWTI